MYMQRETKVYTKGVSGANLGSQERSGSSQGSPQQTKPTKGQFMNFSRGHSGTKIRCESCLFTQGKKPEFTKMGEIHELLVLALSLVWFAGSTPDHQVEKVVWCFPKMLVFKGKEEKYTPKSLPSTECRLGAL